jgi:hypothetical protein
LVHGVFRELHRLNLYRLFPEFRHALGPFFTQ